MAAHRSGEIGSKRQSRLADTSQQSCSASRDSSRRVCRHTGYSAEKSRVTATPAASNRHLALQGANRGIEMTRSKFGCQASRLERLRPYEMREIDAVLVSNILDQVECPNRVTGCRRDYVSSPSGVPQIAANFLRRKSWQSRPEHKGGRTMAQPAVRQVTALQQRWLISRRQFHATSSLMAPTIRTATGSARPRTVTSRTGYPLISTPAIAATMSDTTS